MNTAKKKLMEYLVTKLEFAVSKLSDEEREAYLSWKKDPTFKIFFIYDLVEVVDGQLAEEIEKLSGLIWEVSSLYKDRELLASFRTVISVIRGER